jgi:hypothetical protein
MSKDEALRLALEALVMLLDNYVPEATEEDISQVETTISAIKAALEAKDEPVAWANMRDDGLTPVMLSISQHPEDRANWMNPVPLYATPPQRTWVGLTDEDVDLIANKHATLQGAIWAIEAKLKEKNA